MLSVAHLIRGLPDNFEQLSFDSGAITRLRGIKTPADLMMILLFHLYSGCSLLEISEIGRISKLGNLSDVAVMKRLAGCKNWFLSINETLSGEALINYTKPDWLLDYDVTGVDASVVKEKGATGRLYRLHYALNIFNMSCAGHLITTQEVGESLCNFSFTKNQLVLGDRAYSNIRGIEHIKDAGAKYILRLKRSSFTLRDEYGEKIELLDVFKARNLSPGETADLTLFATNSKGKVVPVRVCATKKDNAAIEKTKKRLKRKESTEQNKMSEQTKDFNEYIVVITNLESNIHAKDILELYRYRWQIETYFKRLKSILDFGSVPKKREDTALAWLNGKIMIALLIEKIIKEASFFPNEQEAKKYLA
jgi:hypothetical protein